MRKLVLLIFFLTLCIPTLAQTKGAKQSDRKSQVSPKIVNLMPAFWAFYDKAKGLPVEEQAKCFKSEIVEKYPDVYTKRVLGFDDDADIDKVLPERYKLWIERVGPHMADVRKLSDNMDAELARDLSSFRTAFPDYSYSGEIYFICSLLAFDGATRTVNGKTVLLFGVDLLATLFGPNAVGPMFHHELFHIHHAQLHPSNDDDDDVVWRGLWNEGLALHVAKTLNPTANNKQIFGFPEDMPERSQKMLPELAREMIKRLDSMNPADYKLFFRGDSTSKTIPRRSGYYVGYQVASALGRKYSLQQLAALEGSKLRKLIEEELEKIAVN